MSCVQVGMGTWVTPGRGGRLHRLRPHLDPVEDAMTDPVPGAEYVAVVPLAEDGTIEMLRRCGNTPERGHHLVQGDDMADDTPERFIEAVLYPAFNDNNDVTSVEDVGPMVIGGPAILSVTTANGNVWRITVEPDA